MACARISTSSRALLGLALLLFSLSTLCPNEPQAGPATLPTSFADELLLGSISDPVGLAEVPGPARRVLFIEQRTARVRLISGGVVTTVGTVPGVVTVDNERGLLGVAIDPGWPARPYLYVHCTDGRSGNHIAISRFTVTGDLGYSSNGQFTFVSTTRYDLINSLPDNASNHNGGTVRFGPDQRLYVSLGDDAMGCPAQDMKQLVGKILRLDVSRLPATGSGPAPFALLAPPDNPFIAQPDSNAMLVWTLGMRNPFRFVIDPMTGTLFIGDVGENTWEELDRVPNGGMDMGWPVREGPAAYSSCGTVPTLTGPVYDYDHGQGVIVIACPLYRLPTITGSRFPATYEGNSFLLDYETGFMRRLVGSGMTWNLAPSVPGQPSSSNWGTGLNSVSDMIEASDGSLWYCRQSISFVANTGEIRRIRSLETTDVEPQFLSALVLSTPRPSPMKTHVTLEWLQPIREKVRLAIYDLGGRRVRLIEAGATLDAGPHSVEWDGHREDGRATDPGIYFARLEVGGAIRETRLALIR